MVEICYRNQQLLKDEEGFSLFLTGNYKKGNTRNKDFVNIVAFSKKDVEEVYDFTKLCNAIMERGFHVFQDEMADDQDLYLLYRNSDTRPINKIKIIKREYLFF